MKNLNDIKLKIPKITDWENISLMQEVSINFYKHIEIEQSEIELKRFVARLVLLQIAEYLKETDDILNAGWSISVVMDEDDNFLFMPVKKLVWNSQGTLFESEQETFDVIDFLKSNHPEILEWYFN